MELPQRYAELDLRSAIQDLPVTSVEFNPAQHELENDQIRVDFENGYGLSIVAGKFAYSGTDTYEVAVVGPSGRLAYDTPITDDVLGYQSPDDIVRVMRECANL